MFTGTIRPIKNEDLGAIKNILPLYWPEQDLQERFLQRLTGIANKDPEIMASNFVGIVAEENGEVIGFAAFRTCPEHMATYVTTDKPAEGYVLAVKNKDVGTGEALVQKALEFIREAGYSEVVLYSGESHKDSWGFYEHLGFENAGPMSAPNGEADVVYKMVL